MRPRNEGRKRNQRRRHGRQREARGFLATIIMSKEPARRYVVEGSGTEFAEVIVGADIEIGFPSVGARVGSDP
jgi:hypothetical protein